MGFFFQNRKSSTVSVHSVKEFYIYEIPCRPDSYDEHTLKKSDTRHEIQNTSTVFMVSEKNEVLGQSQSGYFWIPE